MSVPQVKLTYNATLMRIKVELLRMQCMASELPPAEPPLDLSSQPVMSRAEEAARMDAISLCFMVSVVC